MQHPRKCTHNGFVGDVLKWALKCRSYATGPALNTKYKLFYAKSCSSSSLRPSVPFTHHINNMASKFTVGTPTPSKKCGILMLKNPERNNGIITESLRQLKMFIHQQSSTIMFYCFFGENLSDLKLPGR